MNIHIKRFDKELPLPRHQTDGAAAFDFTVRGDMTIAPHAVGYVPLNVAIGTPPGSVLLLAARSSLHKKGLMLVNGIGVGDPDFSGDSDEYFAALLNFTDKSVEIKRGDRLVQGMFISLLKFEWKEVESMHGEKRGGFGTTGSK